MPIGSWVISLPGCHGHLSQGILERLAAESGHVAWQKCQLPWAPVKGVPGVQRQSHHVPPFVQLGQYFLMFNLGRGSSFVGVLAF